MRSKGVIFDFNGTLFMDSPLHAAAWKQFCPEHFGFVPTDEEIRDQYLGQANLEILRRILGKDATAEEIDRLAKEKEALYREICRKNPASFHFTKGAEAFFDELQAAGIPMAIASGSEYENFSFYMEEMGLKRWFDWDRVIYDDHTLPGKPDPAVYLKTAGMMGIVPGDLTVFEDSVSGIESAIRAGIGQVYALVPETERAFVRTDNRATGIITDFTAAMSLL